MFEPRSPRVDHFIHLEMGVFFIRDARTPAISSKLASLECEVLFHDLENSPPLWAAVPRHRPAEEARDHV